MQSQSTIDPTEVTVHDHLEACRPLSTRAFRELKRGTQDPGELDEPAREYFEHVRQLADDIESDGQMHPCQVTIHGGQTMLLAGYSRFLAAWWLDHDLKITYTEADAEDTAVVCATILAENEDRRDLTPRQRAVLTAKALGLWDSDAESFIPPKHADGQTMTIKEFAETRGGVSPARVWEWLSPLRQNDAVREDFAGALPEDSLYRIQRACETPAQEYMVAQALLESEEVSNQDEFRELVSTARDRVSQAELPMRLYRDLTQETPSGESGTKFSPDEVVEFGKELREDPQAGETEARDPTVDAAASTASTADADSEPTTAATTGKPVWERDAERLKEQNREHERRVQDLKENPPRPSTHTPTDGEAERGLTDLMDPNQSPAEADTGFSITFTGEKAARIQREAGQRDMTVEEFVHKVLDIHLQSQPEEPVVGANL